MTDINDVYRQRNNLAIAFCKAALAAGWPAGRGVDDTKEPDDEWRHVVYVDLPSGDQVSWHMAPCAVHLLEGLPEYKGKWEGTFTARHKNWPALIAAPASPQAAQPVADNSDWENTYGPDYEVGDVGSVSKVDTLLSVRDGYCRCGRLVAGHALSTHADAGEVERLREEIERRRVRGQDCANKVATLRAQLAERDAHLTDALEWIESGSQIPYNMVRAIKQTLSTTAKPEADER